MGQRKQKNIMEIDWDNKDSVRIEDYVNNVKRIFPLNSKKSPYLIWMEVTGKAAKVCEGIRKLEYNAVVDDLAGLIWWWFAFIGRLNDLDQKSADYVIFRIPNCAGDILWRNYPNVCPVCVTEYVNNVKKQDPSKEPSKILTAIVENSIGRPCICSTRKKSVEGRDEKIKQLAQQITKDISEMKDRKTIQTLSDFEKMFIEIYSSSVYNMSPEEIAFHLMEEVGEVSEALADVTTHKHSFSPKNGADLSEYTENFMKEADEKIAHVEKELADVFSWSVSLLQKTRQILDSSSKLSETLNDGQIRPERLKQMLAQLNATTENLTLSFIILIKYSHKGKLGHKKCHSFICKCNRANQLLLEFNKNMPHPHSLPKEVVKKLVDKKRGCGHVC